MTSNIRVGRSIIKGFLLDAIVEKEDLREGSLGESQCFYTKLSLEIEVLSDLINDVMLGKYDESIKYDM